jgi:uncharacterized protein YdeI (BOF family)
VLATVDAQWIHLRSGAVKWVYSMIVAALVCGCGNRDSGNLGQDVEGAPVSVTAARQSTSSAPVVVRGTMTQKCPVAGCWFMLRDESGTIKIDTKNGGFVVTDVPLNSTVTAAGILVVNGSERYVDATGVKY